jgi:transposase
MALGWGGISAVSRATGLSRKAISHGIKDLQEVEGPGEGRIRRSAGGRTSTVSKDARLPEDLERLVEPVTGADPESPLRWTCKSVRKLAEELRQLGHQVSHELVSQGLHELGYSLHANRKTREGGDHPHRNAQFEYVNTQAEGFLAAGEPLVSVDAKKKELVGDFKNAGREWGPQGQPEEVRVYDFPSPVWAVRRLTACTIWGAMQAGSMWAWIMILPLSRWKASGAAGRRLVSTSIPRRNDC